MYKLILLILTFSLTNCKVQKLKEGATFLLLDSRENNISKFSYTDSLINKKMYRYPPIFYTYNSSEKYECTFVHNPYISEKHPFIDNEKLKPHYILKNKKSFLKKHHIITPDTLDMLYKRDEVAIDKAVKLYYKEYPNIIVEPIESIRGYDAINRKLDYRPIYIIDKADFKGNKIKLVEVEWQAWEFE